MKNNNNYEFLLNKLTSLKGVGKKTTEILRKKGITNIFDILWRLPKSFTDRSKKYKINELQIGQISTITIKPIKYSFPRIRNLPNKVLCKDETGFIDCVFFNSYEGYIKKILPLNQNITVSGKIGYYKNKHQITNPSYVSNDESIIEKIHSKYKLTEGIGEKYYNRIIDQILNNLPIIPEWHDQKILKKFENEKWNNSIIKLHDPKNIGNFQSSYYRRLAFDEILASLLISSEIRKKIKKVKKKTKFLILINLT